MYMHMASGLDIFERDTNGSTMLINAAALFHRLYCHLVPRRHSRTSCNGSLQTAVKEAYHISGVGFADKRNAIVHAI